MTHNSQWQVHCEILTGMSQMTILWQLPKIRNIPAFIFFFFFKCANCSANNNPSGENLTNIIYKMICSNTLQTTFLFLNRWLCNSFFEPYCQLSRILWVLKPEMLKSTPGWADLLLPLCFHQFPFHLISAERHGSLSVRTWYSYQCPKNFFFF